MFRCRYSRTRGCIASPSRDAATPASSSPRTCGCAAASRQFARIVSAAPPLRSRSSLTANRSKPAPSAYRLLPDEGAAAEVSVTWTEASRICAESRSKTRWKTSKLCCWNLSTVQRFIPVNLGGYGF